MTTNKTLSMPPLHLTKEDLEKILFIKTVLEKQYHRHFTHQDLAELAGTNERKLRRGFKLVHSQTINEYVTTIRIGKAKELLEDSDMALKVIAVRIGLDKSNLVKSFKRLTGVTPMQ